jgi:hypothetical protein
MEYRRGGDVFYSGLMLAARITLPHFSVSAAHMRLRTESVTPRHGY